MGKVQKGYNGKITTNKISFKINVAILKNTSQAAS